MYLLYKFYKIRKFHCRGTLVKVLNTYLGCNLVIDEVSFPKEIDNCIEESHDGCILQSFIIRKININYQLLNGGSLVIYQDFFI